MRLLLHRDSRRGLPNLSLFRRTELLHPDALQVRRPLLPTGQSTPPRRAPPACQRTQSPILATGPGCPLSSVPYLWRETAPRSPYIAARRQRGGGAQSALFAVRRRRGPTLPAHFPPRAPASCPPAPAMRPGRMCTQPCLRASPGHHLSALARFRWSWSEWQEPSAFCSSVSALPAFGARPDAQLHTCHCLLGAHAPTPRLHASIARAPYQHSQ